MNYQPRNNALLARRDFLKLGGTAALGSVVTSGLFAAEDRYANGLITGETHGELAGLQRVANGSNVFAEQPQRVSGSTVSTADEGHLNQSFTALTECSFRTGLVGTICGNSTRPFTDTIESA